MVAEGAISNDSDEKTHDRDISFCADYYVRIAMHAYDRTELRRSNILTVMSFCLVAEITFCAACFSEMKESGLFIGIAAFQFVFWLAAYIIVIFTRLKLREIVFFPAREEGIHFSPSSEERREFFCDRKLSYKDPEYFFRKNILSETILLHCWVVGQTMIIICIILR